MSAFVAQFANVVNEIRTKISVLPYRADESNAIELTGLWDTGAQFSVITPRVDGLRVSTGDLMVCDMLIGMDIIKHGDMQLTNSSNTSFTFRIPSQGNAPFGA